jgi:hypothetical protein
MKKYSKIVAILTVLVFLFGVVSVANAADATDKAQQKAVERLKVLGVIEGDPDGNLRLNDTITRAEFSKIAVMAAGMSDAAELLKNSPTPFSDVKVGEWYTGWINIAVSQGYVKGFPDGTFKPSDKIKAQEVITIVMRLLGYNENLPGPWPVEFIAKASALGITENVGFVANEPIERGKVFQITNAALDENVVEWNADSNRFEYEVVDKAGRESKLSILEKYLIDEQLTDVYVTAIPRTDSTLDDNEIEIDDVKYTLLVDINFEEVYGAQVKALVKDKDEKELIGVVLDGEVYYDAIEWDSADRELDLANAEITFEFDANEIDDPAVYVDGDKKADLDGLGSTTYLYGKVVTNADGDVVFVEAYTWDDVLVVEKVEDDVVYSYGDELDVEDYTIVKDGVAITSEDVAAGDIFFYNDSCEFAEVYNNFVEGEIDKVFSDSFTLDGEDYDYGSGLYLDDDALEDLDADALDAMKDEGKVKVYLDRDGNVVFVDGSLGEVQKSTVAGYLTSTIKVYNTLRDGVAYIAIDMFNEEGVEVSYDVKATDVDVDIIMDWATDPANTATVNGVAGVSQFEDDWDDYTNKEQDALINHYIGDAGLKANLLKAKGTVIEVTVDEDGDVIELALALDCLADRTASLETDARYAAGKKLSNSVVVFDEEDYVASDDEDDLEVTTWDNVKFEVATKYDVYYNSDDKVTYLVINTSDKDDEDIDEFMALITDVRVNADNDEWRVTAYVEGVKKTYYTDSTITNVSAGKGDVATIYVDANTGELTKKGNTKTIAPVDAEYYVGSSVVAAVYISDKQIKVASGDIYTLVGDGYVFDIEDTSDISKISLRDIKAGDKVAIVLDEKNTYFAKYILLTEDN